MNTTATYSDGNGTEVKFRKSLRNQMFYHHLRESLTSDDNKVDHGERLQYAFIAAYTQDVTGLEWSPPQMGDPAKKIETSYQQFLDAVPDYEMFNALFNTINDLHKPLADVVQRPNEALTEAEQADPN